MKTHIRLAITLTLLSLIGMAALAADPENSIYKDLTSRAATRS